MNDIERAVERLGRPPAGAIRPGAGHGTAPGSAPVPVSTPPERTADPSPAGPAASGSMAMVPVERRSCRLPMRELAATGHLTPETPKTALTEQYRRVKRPLLENLGARARLGPGANVIVVTSSVAGEGKTYTALNLAMSLALERDRTVLLVDADVVKGTATRRLGLPADVPGLIDLLADERLDAGALVTSTDVPDLRVLPAGRSDARATELLSSERMSALMRELASRYPDRIILLDCPPMLATTEASAVIAHAGQVVFVIAEADTPQRDVDEALSRFAPERFVGILMNRSRAVADGSHRYGYG